MILKLEQQVCSLESAKRLKELGFPTDSYFKYRKYNSWLIEPGSHDYIENGWALEELDETPAYTVAELGELLPCIMGDTNWLKIRKTNYQGNFKTTWRIEYSDSDGESHYPYFEDYTEAEARAKMLIYLAENNLINPKATKEA